MSRYFMYGTSLEGIEQLMMLAPNFPQRRSGIVINNHFNCEGGIKICNGCVEKVKSRANPNDCFCFMCLASTFPCTTELNFPSTPFPLLGFHG